MPALVIGLMRMARVWELVRNGALCSSYLHGNISMNMQEWVLGSNVVLPCSTREAMPEMSFSFMKRNVPLESYL